MDLLNHKGIFFVLKSRKKNIKTFTVSLSENKAYQFQHNQASNPVMA